MRVCVCVLCVFGSPLTAVMDGPPSPPHILKEGGGGGMAPTTFLKVLGTNEHVSYVWEASGVEEVAQVKMEGRAR